MKNVKGFLAGLIAVLGMAGGAQANLITNGNFEDGLTGWKTIGNVTYATTSGAPSQFASVGFSGGYALLGFGVTGGNSMISQSFSLSPTHNYYRLSFNWATNFTDMGNGTDRFASLVDLGGNSVFTIEYKDLPGWNSSGSTGSTQVNQTFSGVFSEIFFVPSNYLALDSKLQFKLHETNHAWTNAFAGIDNIQIAPVPEPGTMLLLGSGLAGMAAWRRRRKN